MHEFFSVNFNVVSKLPSANPHSHIRSQPFLTRNHGRVFHDRTAPPDAIFQGHNEPNAKHATCNRRLKCKMTRMGLAPIRLRNSLARAMEMARARMRDSCYKVRAHRNITRKEAFHPTMIGREACRNGLRKLFCNVLLVLSLEMKRHVLKGEKHAKMVLPFCNVLLVLSLEMKRHVLNGCQSVVDDVLARLVNRASRMPSSMCVSPWNFEIWRESHCLRLGWWAHPRMGASRSAQPNLPLQVCVFMLGMACLVHGASWMPSSMCVSP